MFQSVLINKALTSLDVYKNYNNLFIKLGDRVESNQKYGTKNTIDKIKYIRLKYLYPLVETFDDSANKCCLHIQNKQNLITALTNVVK